MKIVFFEIFPKEKDIIQQALTGHDVIFFEDKLNPENISDILDADYISIFVNSIVDREIIQKMPNLKLIATRSTGFDHIDIMACKESSISVVNVPSYGSETVAEFTFALLLTLSRKMFDASLRIKEDGVFSFDNLCGFDLYGKTIGIIGTGKIGKNVINIAQGFGMNVIAYDKFPDKEFALEKNFEYKNIDELVSISDIITLHAPYTEENHHIIDSNLITKMKRGVYIINTARGELIDTEALISGLNSGIIAGAGLDVLEGEKYIKEEKEILANENHLDTYKLLFADHILMKMPQVIITPHVAFYSKEAEEKIINTTLNNIKAFINGKPENLTK